MQGRGLQSLELIISQNKGVFILGQTQCPETQYRSMPTNFAHVVNC